MVVANHKKIIQAAILTLINRIENTRAYPPDRWQRLLLADLHLRLLVARAELRRLAAQVEADNLEIEVIKELEKV